MGPIAVMGVKLVRKTQARVHFSANSTLNGPLNMMLFINLREMPIALEEYQLR